MGRWITPDARLWLSVCFLRGFMIAGNNKREKIYEKTIIEMLAAQRNLRTAGSNLYVPG
jgi:hypothetical protein